MNRTQTHPPQHGFSLIEVLVAIAILAIGLIGLAGTQASALRYNHNALQRSHATQLAYDIADTLRAARNPNNPANGPLLTGTVAEQLALLNARFCQAGSKDEARGRWNAIALAAFGKADVWDCELLPETTLFQISVALEDHIGDGAQTFTIVTQP